MPIFCTTQTTVERQYFCAMKKRITSISVQTWVTRTVNHHSMLDYPDLFADSHLLAVQNPASKCYITKWFIGMIM